jgi:hypothetical protein
VSRDCAGGKAMRRGIVAEVSIERCGLNSYGSKMSAITATIQIEDDAAEIVADMLRQFPKRSRVKLAISEVPLPAAVPDLDEYRRIIASAREKVPRIVDGTTAETMKILREGEEG